jgi:hypothetical protein
MNLERTLTERSQRKKTGGIVRHGSSVIARGSVIMENIQNWNMHCL